MSPSLGREWIEIHLLSIEKCNLLSLPPWGGSGLKSTYAVLSGSGGNVSLLGEGVD